MQYIIAHFRDEVGIIIGVIAKWGGSTLEGVEIGSKELGHNRVLQKFLEESSNKEFGASSKAFSIKTSIHLMTKLKFEKKKYETPWTSSIYQDTSPWQSSHITIRNMQIYHYDRFATFLPT